MPELFTTEPGLRVFSGQSSTGQGGFVGKRGVPCRIYSPNQSGFPSTVLHPGDGSAQTSIYRFSSVK